MYGEEGGAFNLRIKYFDPSKMKKDSITFIIGRRGSGKSTVAEDIMSFHTDIKEGICVSKTDRMNRFWSRHLPKDFIHHNFSDSIIYNLIKHQESKWFAHIKKCKQTGQEPKLSDIDPVFIIFDDVTYDKGFLRSKATRELFMNGRHYNIFVLITCQYLMDMGPDLRTQIDYVIILQDNKHKNKEKMYDYFAGVFPSYAAFTQAFVSCTEGREMMVIDNNALSHDVSECVYFYEAVPDRNYRLCEPDMWKDKNDAFDYDDAQNYVGIEFDDDDLDRDDNLGAQFIGMSRKDKMMAESVVVEKCYPNTGPKGQGDYGSAYKQLPSFNDPSTHNLLKPLAVVQKERKQHDALARQTFSRPRPPGLFGSSSSPLFPNRSIPGDDFVRVEDDWENTDTSDMGSDGEFGFKVLDGGSVSSSSKRNGSRKKRPMNTALKTPQPLPEIYGTEMLPKMLETRELNRIRRKPSGSKGSMTKEEIKEMRRRERRIQKRNEYKKKKIASQLFLM